MDRQTQRWRDGGTERPRERERQTDGQTDNLQATPFSQGSGNEVAVFRTRYADEYTDAYRYTHRQKCTYTCPRQCPISTQSHHPDVHHMWSTNKHDILFNEYLVQWNHCQHPMPKVRIPSPGSSSWCGMIRTSRNTDI